MRVKHGAIVALITIAILSMFAVERSHALYGEDCYVVNIMDENGNSVKRSCTLTVYVAGTNTAATVYSDANRTAIGTTITGVTAGQFKFWYGPGTCDLVVRDNTTGFQVRKNAATPTTASVTFPANRVETDLNFTYEKFVDRPIVSTAASGGGAATGTTGNENLMTFGENLFEYHILGTQTILAPVIIDAATTPGMNIAMDQEANDGVEITQGITSISKHAFTIATDPAFYFKVELLLSDVSGTDDCAVGFRKAEAYQADIDSYDEMACFNIISGVIYTHTILNGALVATDTEETDWADEGKHTLVVRVSAGGVVTYRYDGYEPTTVATTAMHFDDDEVVIPFVYHLNHTDLNEGAVISHWECGYGTP